MNSMPSAPPGAVSSSGSGGKPVPVSYVTRGVKSSLSSQLMASGFSSATALFLLNPISVVRVSLQNERQLAPSSFARIARQVYTTGGPTGFWRGSAAGLVQGVPNTIIYMITYEHLKARLIEDGSILDRWGISKDYSPGIAGVLGRTLSVSLTSPMELLRTRQLSGAISTQGGILKGLQAVFRSEGLRGLYKGWWPTLLRDVPFSALYWHSFERLRWPMRDALEAYMSPRADGGKNSTALRLADFGAGALGGLVSAVVTHPFDVMKTRKQIDDRVESSRLMGMLRQEGWRSLTRGLWLRLATVIPGGAIMVTVYEAVKERTGHM